MNIIVVNTEDTIVPGDLIQYGTLGFWATGMAITVDIEKNSLFAFIVADDCGHSPTFIKLDISKTIVSKLKQEHMLYKYTKNIFDSQNITLDSLKKQLIFK